MAVLWRCNCGRVAKSRKSPLSRGVIAAAALGAKAGKRYSVEMAATAGAKARSAADEPTYTRQRAGECKRKERRLRREACRRLAVSMKGRAVDERAKATADSQNFRHSANV
eukprot:5279155-Pleurochrysis_carterae.AAC.6